MAVFIINNLNYISKITLATTHDLNCLKRIQYSKRYVTFTVSLFKKKKKNLNNEKIYFNSILLNVYEIL